MTPLAVEFFAETLEYERLLVSAGFNHPVSLYDAGCEHQLAGNDFADEVHRDIYAAIVGMVDAGVPVSLAGIVHVLNQWGTLASVAEPWKASDLSWLEWFEPVPFGIGRYAAAVKDAARRRHEASEHLAAADALITQVGPPRPAVTTKRTPAHVSVAV